MKDDFSCENMHLYSPFQKKIALISIFAFLFSLFSPVVSALGEFVTYSDTLRRYGIIDRDLISGRAIMYREALHIAIGAGGYPVGCGPLLSPVCDTDRIARERGLITQSVENTLIGGIIRANAIRLALKSRDIGPSGAKSGFSDVDGKLSQTTYIGYIAKAKEIGCIQSGKTFRPFDYISEGEYAKIMACVVEHRETPSMTFSSAPVEVATTPLSTYSSHVLSHTDVILSSVQSAGSSSYALASDLARLSDRLNTFSSHDPLTLSSSNGLSLSGQALSLTLASSTTTGALSIADYLSFSGKISLSALTAIGPIVYNNTTGQFSWSGTTTSVSEGTNLYFTDTRAQNALSGSLSALSGSINSLSGSLSTTNTNLNTLSGSLSALSGNLSILSGNLSILSGNLSILSGSLSTLSGSLSSLSGSLNILSSSFNTLSGSLISLSGSLSTTNTNLNILSGSLSTLSGNLSILSGSLSTLSGSLSSLSGVVSGKISLSSLSATGGISYNSGTGLFSDLFSFNNGLSRSGNTIGLISGSNGQVLSLSGGSPTWITLGSAGIMSVNGLSSAVQIFALGNTGSDFSIVSSGSTHTFNIPTSSSTATGLLTSIDWTRFDNKIGFIAGNANGLSLSGTGISLALASSTTTGALSLVDWNTFNNKIGSINGLTGVTQTFAIGTAGTAFNIVSSGSIHTFNIPYASLTATGLLSSGDWNIFNEKVSYVSGATNGLNISGSGISLGLASSGSTGALSAIDWTIFNAKLGSLNGQTGSIQTFSTSNTGTDFSITSSGNIHTFNLPDAGETARGLVSTGSQIFTGAKTFSRAPTLSGFSQGAILYVDASGTISQDGSGIFYDATNKRLGLGTKTPVATLHNSGSTVFSSLDLGNFSTGGSIGGSTATVDIKSNFSIAQTTTGQVITLPNPTNTASGRVIYINNVGTAAFTMLGERVEAGQSRQAIWNGSAWKWIGDQQGEMQRVILKTSNETVSGVTLQNDDQLSFSVNGGETWVFSMELLVSNSGSAFPDFQADILGASGWTCNVLLSGNEPAGAAFPQSGSVDCDNAPVAMQNTNILASATQFNVYIQGVITATSAGTVQLRWGPLNGGGSLTVMAGSKLEAYKIRGADLAEVYYTDDATIREGDIVSLTGNGVSQVRKSSGVSDSHTLGIISTKPGKVLGEIDGTGKPVIVGLAGRVPVKVTTKNGNIQPGDYITTSDIPGVGMKATGPGRVIGKALTGFSGIEQGTVVVFIENTYFDGVDEGEYNNSIGASGSVSFAPNYALDRFSFMVKKSLTKIDPSFASGSQISTFGGQIDALARGVATLSDQVSTTSVNYQKVAQDLVTLQEQVRTLEAQTGTFLSPKYQAVLDRIESTTSGVSQSVQMRFGEAITFMSSVIFEGDVTIRGRTTFEDRDMAGTAKIQKGSHSVSVLFERPYEVLPRITATADGFTSFRIQDKSKNGFTIEVPNDVREDISFDWIALSVRGGQETLSSAPENDTSTQAESSGASLGESPILDTGSQSSQVPSSPSQVPLVSGEVHVGDTQSSSETEPVDISTINPEDQTLLVQSGGAIIPSDPNTLAPETTLSSPPPPSVPVTETVDDPLPLPDPLVSVYEDPENNGSPPPTGPPATSTDPPIE